MMNDGRLVVSGARAGMGAPGGVKFERMARWGCTKAHGHGMGEHMCVYMFPYLYPHARCGVVEVTAPPGE